MASTSVKLSPVPMPAPLSLALQGGGSFGAFTWGVLDRLLEEGIVPDAVSGTSAGAVNAVALAAGLAEGGPDEARRRLESLWTAISRSTSSFARLSHTAAGTVALAALRLSTQVVSPYQFNPLGLNPLRDILAAEIDFDRLRASRPVRLLIAATRVRDGRTRLFRETEITLEAVLASACLPQIHHAVEIDGEAYWDGGYSANPPLRQLVIDGTADDVLLVQIAPETQDGTPHLSDEISRRIGQLTFTAALHKEMEALTDLCALCRQQGSGPGGRRSPLCRKLDRLRLHRIVAEEVVPDLQHLNPLDGGWPMLTRLRDSGHQAAQSWLSGQRHDASGHPMPLPRDGFK